MVLSHLQVKVNPVWICYLLFSKKSTTEIAVDRYTAYKRSGCLMFSSAEMRKLPYRYLSMAVVGILIMCEAVKLPDFSPTRTRLYIESKD